MERVLVEVDVTVIGGEGGRLRLQQAPQLAVLAHVARRRTAAHIAATGRGVDRARQRQAVQRLADRCAADIEPTREVFFGEPRTGLQVTPDDRFTERRVDSV